MNRAIEQLIWNGRATFKTQTFGLGAQFVLPIGEQNTGIITKIVFSPFSFQPGTDGEFITAPVQEIIISDGRRSIRKAIKNFESGVIKGDSKYISQGQNILSQLYYPFFADAPIFINLNGNNIAFQLGSPFNQLVRDGLEPGYEATLQAAINNGDAIPSLDQQYWQNELYKIVAPLIAANRILIFVNGKHDSGDIEFSKYDWSQPGIKYGIIGAPQSFTYQINRGTSIGGGTSNFGFNGLSIPATNPKWIQYRAAFAPRGGFISGDSTGTQSPEVGTNRNGAFAGDFIRGWNQTLGTQINMNRPGAIGRCISFAWQQTGPAPEIDYYLNGVFTEQVTQPDNQAIPANEGFLLFARQGQTASQPVNGIQFLHTGLTPAEIANIHSAIQFYCANLANPAPVPTTPTGIIQSFLTVYYIEINGNVLNTL